MTNIKVFANGNEVKYTTKEFNDGDLSVKFDPTDLNPDFRLTPDIKVAFHGSSKNLLELEMVLNAIKSMLPDVKVSLDIPYLPFNRQDKVFNDGEPRSLEIVAKYLKNLVSDGFVHDLRLYDLHNENEFKKLFPLTPDNELKRMRTFYQELLDESVKIFKQYQLLPLDTWESIQNNEKIVVFPDKGACEKIGQYGGDIKYIRCEKERDPETGHLSNFSISGTYFDETKENPYFIIVDDICEGGGTFLGLHDVIKEKYPNCKIDLHTTFRVHENGIERYKELDEKFENVTYWYNIKEKTYYDK